MSILTANLKHLYQRRALWLFYPFVALLLPAMALGSFHGGSRAPALLLVAVIGLILGSGQRDVISRPFSFLLPRHGGVVPRQALLQSVLFGALVPLCWLRLTDVPLGQHLAVLLAAWLLGMACYLAGTLGSFSFPFVAPFLGFVPLVIFASIMLAIPPVLDTAIHDFPLRTGAVALAGIAGAWHFLRRRDLARHWALQRAIAFFDEFNFAKANQYHLWRRAQKTKNQPEPGSPALVRVLLAGIAACSPQDLRRYICATWYEWFGLVTAKRWFSMFLTWPVLVVFMGYLSGGTNSVILFVMPVIMVASLRRTYLATYLPAGRAQRHLAAVAGMLIVTVLTSVLAWLCVLISQAIAPSMSPIKLPMGALKYAPFPYLYALIPTVLAPIAFAAAIWLKRQASLILVVAVPIIPVMLVVLRKPLGIPLAYGPVAALISLLASVAILRYHCLRRDLA